MLSKDNKPVVENKNRKDYADQKWDQEVRASLAAKKAAAPGGVKLSKADQALVDAQKAKEAEVRQRIATLQAQLKRGIELVAALVASNAESVERHAGDMAKAMLSTVFGRGSFLVDERAFDVFLVSIYNCRRAFLLPHMRTTAHVRSQRPRSWRPSWASTAAWSLLRY